MCDICGKDIIQWQDIDFDNKVIRITKSYQRLEGKDVVTDPKTPKSKRNISMPDFLCEELKEYLGRLYGLLPTYVSFI